MKTTLSITNSTNICQLCSVVDHSIKLNSKLRYETTDSSYVEHHVVSTLAAEYEIVSPSPIYPIVQWVSNRNSMTPLSVL